MENQLLIYLFICVEVFIDCGEPVIYLFTHVEVFIDCGEPVTYLLMWLC